MCLTSKVKISKSFYENYKRMHLITGIYDIMSICLQLVENDMDCLGAL